MKNKKMLITAVIAILVVAGIAVAYFAYTGSDYVTYSSAFKKTFNTGSMELNTSVEASVDGTDITSTGNFKLMDVNTDTPKFINTMTIDEKTITQFCDGEYIYTDDGQTQNKIKMGESEVPVERQEKENTEFTYESYIQEFSSLLDASKIKQLESLEPIPEKFVDKIDIDNSGSEKRFIVTLLPEAVDEMVDSFISENLSTESIKPTIDLKAISYSATVSGDYISEIVFSLDLDITAPDETDAKSATVDFTIKPVNPGQDVSFELPSTEGF